MSSKRTNSPSTSNAAPRCSAKILSRCLASSLVLLLAASSPAQAALKCTTPEHDAICDADGCVQPLAVGERAEFPGQLMSTDKALVLGTMAADCGDRIVLEVAHTSSIAAVELAHEREIHAIDVRTSSLSVELWKNEATEWKTRALEARPWYTEPVVVIIATAAVTTLVLVGGAAVADKFRN